MWLLLILRGSFLVVDSLYNLQLQRFLKVIIRCTSSYVNCWWIFCSPTNWWISWHKLSFRQVQILSVQLNSMPCQILPLIYWSILYHRHVETLSYIEVSAISKSYCSDWRKIDGKLRTSQESLRMNWKLMENQWICSQRRSFALPRANKNPLHQILHLQVPFKSNY